MPALLSVTVTVKDTDRLKEYIGKVPATMAPFNAKMLSRGKITKAINGEPSHQIEAVFEFEDAEGVIFICRGGPDGRAGPAGAGPTQSGENGNHPPPGSFAAVQTGDGAPPPGHHPYLLPRPRMSHPVCLLWLDYHLKNLQ